MIIQKFLLAATFFLSTPVVLADESSRNLNADCQSFIAEIGSHYFYNWIEVPEMPSSNNMISVFYYYKKANTFKNPVIFFNGGPGYSSHNSPMSLEVAKIKFGGGKELNIDFVYMDQRGTGCSTGFPIGASVQIIEKLKWYGSAGIVTDAEALRIKLIGEKKWKVFGQSYGSHVVHRYLKMFPTSIAKAYAHGYPEGPSDFDFSFSRIAAQGVVLRSYLENHASDRARLKALNVFLSDRSKCFRNGTDEYCGFENLSPLIYLLGFRDNWNSFHAWLVSIVPADTVAESGLKNFIEKLSTRYFFYHDLQKMDDSYLDQVSIALNFLGIVDTNSTPIDYDKCMAIYKKMETVYKIKQSDMLLNECQAPVQFAFGDQLRAIISNRMTDEGSSLLRLEDIKSALTRNKIPFYLYSGGLDSFVPRDLFQLESKTLGSLVNYTNFSESGHDGYVTEKKVLIDLAN